jgi:hypothetical protein
LADRGRLGLTARAPSFKGLEALRTLGAPARATAHARKTAPTVMVVQIGQNAEIRIFHSAWIWWTIQFSRVGL